MEPLKDAEAIADWYEKVAEACFEEHGVEAAVNGKLLLALINASEEL
jgi:hypothetical protein